MLQESNEALSKLTSTSAHKSLNVFLASDQIQNKHSNLASISTLDGRSDKKNIGDISNNSFELNLTRSDIDSMIGTIEKYMMSKRSTEYYPNHPHPTHCRTARRLLYSLSLYYIAAKTTMTDMSSIPQSLEISVLFNCLVKYKTQFQKLIMQLKGGIFSMGKIPCKSIEADLINPISFVRYTIAYHIFQCSAMSKLFKLYGLFEEDSSIYHSFLTDNAAVADTDNSTPIAPAISKRIVGKSFDGSIGNFHEII